MITDTDTLKIQSYLDAIEQDRDVTIQTAWLGGSHAWGVESEHSDFDIYFIYTQRLTDYATICAYESAIDITGEHVESGVAQQLRLPDLEFTGWDVRHFAELINDSNPIALEMLVGGIPVKSHPAISDLKEYAETHFHNIELYQHYRGHTGSHYKKYIESRKQTDLKRVLYLLRAAFSAEYIRHKKSFPPMKCPELAERTSNIIPSDTHSIFTELVERKQHGESGEINESKISTIEPFVTSVIERAVGSDEFNQKEHIPDQFMEGNEIDQYLMAIITGFGT